MFSSSMMVELIETFALPCIGVVALTISKLLVGTAAVAAQRWFLSVLVAVTMITCWTVIQSGEHWLSHTATLAMMFLGAVLVPDRVALAQRRITKSTPILY
ncbi:MAG: hypothetical protein RI963_3161 [Planctomycetota bacterium]|jgi:hypothetical protein